MEVSAEGIYVVVAMIVVGRVGVVERAHRIATLGAGAGTGAGGGTGAGR